MGVFPGLALLSSIPLILFLVRTQPLHKAAAIAILASAMFLPEHAGFDLPVFPKLDKITLPAFFLSIVLLFEARPRNLAGPLRFLFVIFVIDLISAYLTYKTNTEAYVVGLEQPKFLPGLSLRDVPNLVIWDVFYIFLPFFVGAATCKRIDLATDIIRILVKAGLIFSLFCLFEIRMSPNLHLWVYGYPGCYDFAQTIRWGGYRPSVFFYHGLIAAFFMLLTVISAATAYRIRLPMGSFSGKWVLPYLMVVLVLCKSTGAILYATFIIPAIVMLKPRRQLLLVILLAAIVTAYPVLRATENFPLDSIMDWAESLSAERAESLWFRFSNEEKTLVKMVNADKLMFGWGGYGRSHTYHEWTGYDLTVLDGLWIIDLCRRGLVGSLTHLAVLFWPLVLAWRTRRHVTNPRHQLVILAFAWMVAMAGTEMLINDPRVSLHWFAAGCLFGVTKELTRARPAPFAQSTGRG